MQLHIASDLIQHYVLDVEPLETDNVIEEIVRLGVEASATYPEVGRWNLFFWLERPALWALRPVRITTGLDSFLFQDNGLPGVTDVAELITHVLVDSENPGRLANSWQEFVAGDPCNMLFASFLWLNWDAIGDPKLWPDGKVPPNSAILAAFRRAIGVRASALGGARTEPPRLLLASTTGDADLVLYGFGNHIAELDGCLYLVNQMACKALADELGFSSTDEDAAERPVVHRSRTELAVELSLYRGMLRSGGNDLKQITRINEAVEGHFTPEIALTRGGGSITAVHDRISDIIGGQWKDEPVFGRDDFVVRMIHEKGGTCGLGDLLALCARLDVAHVQDAGFPRRSSLRLGFSAPIGRSKTPDLSAGKHLPPAKPSIVLDRLAITSLTSFIQSLRALRWREDLRIMERIAERCVTLQKAHTLPRETRRMLANAFQRFGAICGKIQDLETVLEKIQAESNPPSEFRGQAALREEIQLYRWELHHSGAGLDRVLSHHSRGVIDLLLHPASQARGTSHFASEIGLSSGLGIFFRAPAQRLRQRLAATECPEHATLWRTQLAGRLDQVSQPIIYASHEPDFSIRPGLTLLRVPTWALWLPTTHLLHEFAHALAVVGPLHYLARKVLARGGGGFFCPCPHFEQKIAALGLELQPPGAWIEPAPLAMLAREYFRDGQPPSAGLPRPHAHEQHTLEEIAADMVERLLGYPLGEAGDRMHLWNFLPSMVPYALRMDSEQIQRRVHHLFAAQLAVQLASASRAGHLQLLAPETHEFIRQMTTAHAARFQSWLKEWFGELFETQAMSKLSRAGYQMIGNLQRQCDDDFSSLLPKQTRFSHLLAIILSLTPVTETTFQSLFKASHVWGNLWPLAREADEHSGDTDALAGVLARGIVPTRSPAFPERLVAAVIERFRTGTRAVVAANSRVALSHYLESVNWQ